MNADEERIALFLDYENLAIGAREALGRKDFDFRPIADALAERGRVVVRRAYADWTRFDDDMRMLTRHQIELIEIPQRMGLVRKNAADIKMAVDAIELSFERDYITTFVLGTGDSDFTPLVHKLRELNRRVIGVGIEASTSLLLPPACDEFLFYERLEGVDPPSGPRPARSSRRGGGRRRASSAEPAVDGDPGDSDDAEEVGEADEAGVAAGDGAVTSTDLIPLLTQTLSGLERTSDGPVLASRLKRAMLRKDPTFNEADHGFRAFGELLRNLEANGVVDLVDGSAQGDPEVHFPRDTADEDAAFELLRTTVERLSASGAGPVHLSGLKTQLRKTDADFSEKRFGYGGFLQFAKAARARGVIDLDFDDQADDYVLRLAAAGAPQP